MASSNAFSHLLVWLSRVLTRLQDRRSGSMQRPPQVINPPRNRILDKIESRLTVVVQPLIAGVRCKNCLAQTFDGCFGRFNHLADILLTWRVGTQFPLPSEQNENPALAGLS
jgi:hypothetical protein